MLYDSATKCFSDQKVSDPLRLATIEVGDSKQTDLFYPQLKTLHWDNECNFSCRLSDLEYEKAEVTEKEGVVEWKLGERRARFYHKDSTDENGAFEFEVEWAARPVTGRIEFSIQHKGFNFFRQGELTEWEIKRGAVRPDNVLGSYAAFHESKRDNITGQKEYRTGKAFHIYRPHATDSNGKTVWCDLNIDTDNGLMTIDVPEDFLDDAVYPVIVDPTFGYTTIGGTSSSGFPTNELDSTLGTPASSGDVDSVSWYGAADAATKTFKGVIFDKATKTILTNGVTPASAAFGTTPAWTTVNYSSKPAVTSATDYYVGFVVSGAVTLYYDAGAANDEWYDGSNSYTTPTNPTDGAQFAFHISIYATYTVGGALSGTTSIAFGATSVLTGSGAISGATSLTFGGAGGLAGSGALAAAASLTFGGAGSLIGSGALSGSAPIVFGGVATLTGNGTLGGATQVVFGGTGALSGDGDISGACTITFSPSGSLDTGAISGETTIVFGASGDLTGTSPSTTGGGGHPIYVGKHGWRAPGSQYEDVHIVPSSNRSRRPIERKSVQEDDAFEIVQVLAQFLGDN